MRLKVEDADDDYAVEYFDESVDDDVLMMKIILVEEVMSCDGLWRCFSQSV